MKEEISNWRTKMGLDFITRPQEDKLKAAVELSTIQLDNMPLVDLDEFLLVLSNYYVYLGSEIGRLSARARFLSDELQYKVSNKTQSIGGGTAEERRSLIISLDEKLGDLSKTLTMTRAQIEQLNPVYDAIKMKLDSLKRIYFRRTSEKRD